MLENNLLRAWPEWKIEKRLGAGTYGVVYQVVRSEYNFESRAAVKVINIPPDNTELDALCSEGLDLDGARTYLREVADDFINEVRLMETLKGTQNIVGIEDYKILEKEDSVGWEIYIRMELLTPLQSLLCAGPMGEAQVIQLGREICAALALCASRGILHRDIKPENIFVNDFGHFKLGDFGVARKLEGMTNGLSQRGTFSYMAPEVARGERYDARADVYSLGLVLYRLLNKNRLPFLDTEKQLLSPGDRKRALERRLGGETPPPPSEASPTLGEVILQACAYDPNKRFSSAEALGRALACLGAQPAAGVSRPAPAPASVETPSSNRKRRKIRRGAAVPVLCAAALFVSLGVFLIAGPLADRGSGRGDAPPDDITSVGGVKDPDDGFGGGGGLVDPDGGEAPDIPELVPTIPGSGAYSDFVYVREPGEETGKACYIEDGMSTLSISYDTTDWFDIVSVTLDTEDTRILGARVLVCIESGAGPCLTQAFYDGMSFEVSVGTYLLQFETAAEDPNTLNLYSATVTFDHSGNYTIDPDVGWPDL